MAVVLCAPGRADRRRPERRDPHLGSEDGPQRAADPRARRRHQLRPHRPGRQLHGSGQQLGQWPWTESYSAPPPLY